MLTTKELPSTISLTWLEETLDALPRDKTEAAIESNLALLHEIGQRERIHPLFKSILADENALEIIADRSYRHVNHFDKIVLVDSGDRLGYRLTLHLWNPPYTEEEVNDELIHDHRFSFWSNILTGDLHSENFIAAKEGRSYRGYRYVPEKREVSTTSNFYEFVGETELVTVTPSKEVSGSVYYLSYERIHRVILPRQNMTCTLVLRGPREREFSTVYNTSYPSQNTRATNKMFTVTELTGKLKDLVAELEKKSIGT